MNIAELIRKHTERREQDHDEIKAALYACGWGSKSSLPGSLWLWTKSFPESKTQWRWEGHGADARKVPNPPFTVDGVSLDVAVQMEASWQALWDDNRPRPSADDEQEEPNEDEVVTSALAEIATGEAAD